MNSEEENRIIVEVSRLIAEETLEETDYDAFDQLLLELESDSAGAQLLQQGREWLTGVVAERQNNLPQDKARATQNILCTNGDAEN
jgi:hypothetical protein